MVKGRESIYGVANLGVTIRNCSLTRPGHQHIAQITDGIHSIAGGVTYHTTPDKMCSFEQPHQPGDVWTMAPAATTAAAASPTCSTASSAISSCRRRKRSQWKGADGVTVEGLLYLSDRLSGRAALSARASRRTEARAADKLSRFGSWSTYRPVLAAKGYAVLQPNYRGSTGYGDDFLRDMVGHYFEQAHLDVMTGVDYLIQLGIADPDRW